MESCYYFWSEPDWGWWGPWGKAIGGGPVTHEQEAEPTWAAQVFECAVACKLVKINNSNQVNFVVLMVGAP